jgi:hypothetical protein
MRAAVRDHAAEAAQRRASAGLVVIGKAVEKSLNRSWRAERSHEPALCAGESGHLVMSSSGHRCSIAKLLNRKTMTR